MSNQSAYSLIDWLLRTKTPEEEENDRRQDQSISDACAKGHLDVARWLVYRSGDYKWERRKYCVWMNDESFWRERTNPIQKLPSDIGKMIALYL